MERTERVIEHLLREQPHLRPFLTSLPAMYRLMLERGINAYEAELGLGPMEQVSQEAPKKTAKSRKAG